MNRRQLEQVIRAAGDIADDDEIVVVGSQAILGQFPEAPGDLLVSNEADVYPKNKTERWELIDGSIGELSLFHETYGYYARGVEEGTAVLPAGWRERLHPVRNENTRGVTGWCLDVHDLVLSKYVARRDKDLRFVRSVIRHGLADERRLLELAEELPVDEATKRRVADDVRFDVGTRAPRKA